MAKKTLFEISQDMQAFDDLLEESEGGFDDPEVQEILAKMGDEIMGDLENKVDNYAAYIQTLTFRAKARKEEAKRLTERAKISENHADRMKDFLKKVLEFNEVKKIDTPRFLVSVAGNGGKQPLECNVLPEDLPDEYRTEKVTYAKNGDAIREALLAGKEVAGCRLLERGTSLRIK